MWIPDERKIDISRDVEFLDMPEALRQTQKEPEPKEEDIAKKPNEVEFLISDDSPKDENEDKEDHVTEDEDEDHVDKPLTTRRRGPGRPRKEMTGRRGRLRKLFQIARDTTEQAGFSFLVEVPVDESLKGYDAEEWIHAMAAEMKSILHNNTWELVDRPKGCEIIGSRYVLRNKMNQDSTLEWRKARIVARGFSQRLSVDFNETFAPVACLGSIRVVAALAAQHDMKIHQIDVTTAYLNGELEEQIFMEIPKYTERILEEIVISEKKGKIADKAASILRELRSKDKVCLLRKALYGLRQAERRWHVRLRYELEKFGLKQSTADPCVFFKGKGENILIITVYVDDILVASRDLSEITKLTEHLSKSFQIKDFGEVKYCLGIEFTQNKDGITLCQKGYINDTLERFGMKDSKPVATPLDCSQKLRKSEDDFCMQDEGLHFRELVGRLIYLAMCTRPDISYTVSHLGQFNNCYNETHWKAAKRVLRYLKETSTRIVIQEIYRTTHWLC